MRSERAVGRALKQALNEGIIKRNEVIICSKGGFISYDYREKVEPRTHVEEKYVKTGLFQWDEFVGGVHCLSVPFIMNQVRIKIETATCWLTC
jgi:aryl-alcohol dehydrogenase-like predicted oxidoreductase